MRHAIAGVQDHLTLAVTLTAQPERLRLPI